MTHTRGRLAKVLLLSTWLIISLLLLSSPPSRVAGYMPVTGHQTQYDYGFVNTRWNQSAEDIPIITGLTLTESNYTVIWHQYVNLSISVIATSPTDANYEFTVIVHSNIVTISNSTWQREVALNGSVEAPSPTGVISGIFQYPISSGLPGFFLDETTLASIPLGNDVMVGDSRWDTITNTSYTLGESTESCYQLQNTSIILNTLYETQHVIDQDVGIYFSTTETTTLTFGPLQQTLTYYFRVLSTTVPLFPPPNLILTLLVIAVIVIIAISVVALAWRFISRRRRRVLLPPEPESG